MAKATGTTAGRGRTIKSLIGELPITEKQARRLKISKNNQISPSLEQCCLRASANVSYENAARDIHYYTGIKVAAKTQQRLVQRHEFVEEECQEAIEELSLDGGKVRLKAEEKGEGSIWREYKAISLNSSMKKAWFAENEALVTWVNQQPMSEPLTCLGDGHSGVWNLVAQLESPGEKREILDWFHLMENLYKIGGSLKRLKKAESLLWRGKVAETLELMSRLTQKAAKNFCVYLESHRHRIINYDYYQQE